jgi:hypothetical protein
MLGISFAKLLLLVLVVAAVWAGVTIYKRAERKRELAQTTPPALDPIKTSVCRVCGTYRANGAARCARTDCPVV